MLNIGHARQLVNQLEVTLYAYGRGQVFSALNSQGAGPQNFCSPKVAASAKSE
jgi:hypothetical protein